MARIILVTGGGRSGKSSYAQRLAEEVPGPRAFVATSPVIDEEMRERIRKHRKARSRSQWHTIEETIELVTVLSQAKQYEVVLVDCLALWVNNLMFEAEKTGRRISEEEVERRCRELLGACSRRPGTVVFVTNEVGLGIIPENALARSFRDLLGRCNQVMAAGADEVTLMICGIPVKLKQG